MNRTKKWFGLWPITHMGALSAAYGLDRLSNSLVAHSPSMRLAWLWGMGLMGTLIWMAVVAVWGRAYTQMPRFWRIPLLGLTGILVLLMLSPVLLTETFLGNMLGYETHRIALFFLQLGPRSFFFYTSALLWWLNLWGWQRERSFC